MSYNESADPSEKIVSLLPKDSYLWWKPAIVGIDAFAIGGLIIGASACGLCIYSYFKPAKKEEGENE